MLAVAETEQLPVAAARAGEAAAWDALFRRYQLPLYVYVVELVQNEQASLDLLNDVQLDLKIELGRTQMHLEDVLRMKNGSVVTLDKLAGDPVDIYANGRLIARGEVLVLNDNFCVRVAELISGEAAA